MNFFKQAQEFAASANVGGDQDNKNGAGESGGFGSLMGEAQSMFKTAQEGEGAPAAARTNEDLPGGRRAPTNAELTESSKLLYGAAQGQKVSNQQLAGAAEDLLGGLASHGKLDQGQYSTYINQAEQYLHKYSGQDDAAERSAPPAARAEEDDAPVPAAAARPAAAEQESEAADPARAPAPAQEAADEGAGFSLPGKVPSWMNDRA